MSANHRRPARVIRASLAALRIVMFSAICLLSLLTGCQAAMPRATDQAAVPAETNAELVEYISDQPFVTAESACRAIYILANGEIFEGSYDELTQTMKSSDLLGDHWTHQDNEFLNRAAIGYLVARACKIRSGLNWRLTGWGRYAYRELIYLKIAHVSGELNLISGGEFLGLLARAEEYLHKTGRVPGEAAELGQEPG